MVRYNENLKWIDKEVGEKVFRLDVSMIKKSYSSTLPQYSMYYDDAWKIVEKIRTSSIYMQKAFLDALRGNIKTRVPADFGTVTDMAVFLWATPKDICIAALEIMGDDKRNRG